MAEAQTAGCFDVCIAGGGPVGLTLALCLAAEGFGVVLADAGPPPGRGSEDNRAYFIAYGCWRILRALGLEPELLDCAEPVREVDAEGRLGGISFLAGECGEPLLGYMIEHAELQAILYRACLRQAGLRLLTSARISNLTFAPDRAILSAGDTSVSARVVVGCDGAGSRVRAAAGIRFEGHHYASAAISATLSLPAGHGGVARQIFLPRGPMAVLPLRDNRANLIWTEEPAVAQALLALGDSAFERELAKAAGAFLPEARLAGPRHVFRLGLFLAERFDGHRFALAGDAAHVIHPLAGQGLNLGLKDVAALVDVLSEARRVGLDIGEASALAPYTRWRRADVAITAAAMEGFARAFSAPLPVRLAAGAAMAAVGRLPVARRFFARQAGGDLGELPRLMRPAPVQPGS